jgi:hypothetical protein
MRSHWKLILLLILTTTTHSTVFCQPVIQSFSPTSGAIGTTVTIRGSGFDKVTSNNIVFFGAVRSTVSASTDTSIITTVPTGASYQPITITNSNGTAYSRLSFTVTFSAASTPFTATSFLPKNDITTSYYPHAISIADFNNDGKPDVVVAKGSSSTVSVLTNTSSNNTVSFSTPLELTAAGNSHECAATGDLDGDGKPDLVTANTWNTSSISVFRNTTSGATISFALKADYATDNGPYSVAISDINGDGKPDIITANNGSDHISLFKNTSTPGNISFDNRIDISAPTSPFSITASDLDGDGKPELIYTTQNTSSNVSVMKNKSTASSFSFDNPIALAGFAAPFVVAVGDLDGDGLPDIAAASGGGYIIVKKNISTPGNLAFSGMQMTYATADYAECVAIADMDGDGKPDLAAANRGTKSVSVLRNTSSSGSISFDSHVDFTVGDVPIYLAIADLNGDQRPDIVSANSSSTFISVLTNAIGANITPAIKSFTPASGVSGTTVTIKGSNFTGATAVTFGGVNAATFTVNADTMITAVLAQGNTGDVAVTTSKGTASLPGFTFNGPTISSFTPSIGVAGTTVSITGTNFTNANAVQFGGTPAASFTVVSSTTISAVLGNGSSGDVLVTTPNGTATRSGFSFGAPAITSVAPLSAPVGATVTITGKNFSAVAADNIVFFGAVKANIISSTTTQLNVIVPAGATYSSVTVTVNHLTAYSSLMFSTSFAADSITLSTRSFSKAGDYSVGNYPVDISICDLNDDGKPDIITANASGNSISVLKNISTPGNLSYQQKVDLLAGPNTRRTVTGDLDGDGKPDVVAMNANSGNASTISVFLNTSTGSTISFGAKTDYSTGNGTQGVAIADMNGDGKPDIITTSGNSGFFSIFLNTSTPGNFKLAPKVDFTNLNHADEIVVADIDGDKMPDIIVSEFSNNSISVYRNTSNGGNLQLGSRIPFSVGTYPSNIEVADMNGDGKLDVILRCYTATTVVLKNTSSPGYINLQQAYDFATTNFSNGSVSDLNGDGKPDICFGRTSSGNISLVENKYTVASTPLFGSTVDFWPGTFDSFVATGDLDGDGKPELIAANTTLNTVTLYSNKIDVPSIDNLMMLALKAGDTLHITGSNLMTTTSVKFGGTEAASFKVISANAVDAVVANGTSGNITLTTTKGTAVLAGFQFIPVISVTGNTSVCGGTQVPLTSSADANNQWYINDSLIAGATSKIYSVTRTGKYTVKTTGNNVTTTSPKGVDVTVTNVPTPVISRSGNNLLSSATIGNQWYLNGTAIQAATAPSYQSVQSGDYTVQASVNGCTSEFSKVMKYVPKGVINLPNGQFVNLYPNPVTDKMVINYQLDDADAVSIEIIDSNGRHFKTVKGLHSGDVIHLSDLPAGMYIIKVTSKNNVLGSAKIYKVK